MGDPMELIREWKSHADNLSSAVEERDYEKFRKAFADGTKCFNQIRAMIEAGGREKETLSANREAVAETVARWEESAEKIPAWMGEIKDLVKKRRTVRANDKKIGNAYKFMKKTGLNLKVRAR